MKDNADIVHDFKLLNNDSSDVVKKKKKKSHKHDKRKSDILLNGDASGSSLTKTKRVKKVAEEKSQSKHYLTSHVMQVVAEPGELLPTPSVFNKSNRERLPNKSSPSSFIKSKINYETLYNKKRFTNSLNLVEETEKLAEKVAPPQNKEKLDEKKTPPQNKEKIVEEPECPKDDENTKVIIIDDIYNVLTKSYVVDKEREAFNARTGPAIEKVVLPSPVKKTPPIEIKKKKNANIHTYQVPHQNAFILHIKHPSEFTFTGKMNFALYAGCVEIFGLVFRPPFVSYVFSPKFCSSFKIETLIPEDPLNIEELEEELFVSNLITKSDMKKLLNEIKPYDSVAMVKDVTWNFTKVFEKYSDKELFTNLPVAGSILPEVSQSLPCVFSVSDSKEFKINPDWTDLPLQKRNLICGGKNVGKSSLMKYYINKCIPEVAHVLCLDLDPGQPEYCPPGCLAATVVKMPALGPNFTQINQPEMMVYFGEISVAQQPTAYLEAVKFIIDYYKNDPVLSKMPCIANTMGFCKGLGVALTVSIIKLLRPECVIQITSSDSKNNFPYHFTPECLKYSEGHLFNIPDTSDFTYGFHLLESVAEEDGVPNVGGLKPRELRDLKFLSYFSQMVTRENPNFNSVQPYSIQFSKLYLAVHGAISPSEILKAFNGNMVALCQYKPDLSCEFLEPVEKDYFKILTKPKVMPCLALGFVRGIDIAAKRIYVITPLSDFKMESVNCLMLGFVPPPHSIYLKQDTVEGPIPYTSINSGDNVQMVKKIFRFPRNQTTP